MSHELSLVELDAESAELLPAREALSVKIKHVNVADITALNGSAVLNTGGFLNYGESTAVQGISVTQIS